MMVEDADIIREVERIKKELDFDKQVTRNIRDLEENDLGLDIDFDEM